MRRFPEPRPAPGQLPYFWGGVTLNWVSWQAASLIGIFAAHAIPTEWGVGFAGTLALLGLLCSLLGSRPSFIAAVVAGGAAVAAYALPLRLNILVAIAAAVVIGLVIDHTTPRRAEPAEDRT